MDSLALPIALAALTPFTLPQADDPPAAKPTPEIAWDHTTDTAQFTDLVHGDGRVYCLDRSGSIHAVDAAEGDPVWVTETGRDFSRLFGIAYADRPELNAVVVTCDTAIFALDPATGEQLWRTEMPGGLAGPAIADDAIVAAGGDGLVYGFTLAKGKLLWSSDYLEDAPEDPPGFDGARARFDGQPARPGGATTDGTLVVFTVFDQCRAVAVDAKTGERRWAFASKGWMGATPAIDADSVYLGSQDRHLYAVDKRTGEERWKIRTGSRVSAGALSAGGHVYFGSCDARLYGLGRADGAKAWAFETEHAEGRGAPIYGSPVVIGDTIYLGAMAGKVYAVARETGKLRWSVAPMPGSEINSDLRTDGERLFMTTRRDIDGKGESVAIAVELP